MKLDTKHKQSDQESKRISFMVLANYEALFVLHQPSNFTEIAPDFIL